MNKNEMKSFYRKCVNRGMRKDKAYIHTGKTAKTFRKSGNILMKVFKKRYNQK